MKCIKCKMQSVAVAVAVAFVAGGLSRFSLVVHRLPRRIPDARELALERSEAELELLWSSVVLLTLFVKRTRHRPYLERIPAGVRQLACSGSSLLPRDPPRPRPVSLQRFLTAPIRPSPSFKPFKASWALRRTWDGRVVLRATARKARRWTSHLSAETRLRMSRRIQDDEPIVLLGGWWFVEPAFER